MVSWILGGTGGGMWCVVVLAGRSGGAVVGVGGTCIVPTVAG